MLNLYIQAENYAAFINKWEEKIMRLAERHKHVFAQ